MHDERQGLVPVSCECDDLGHMRFLWRDQIARADKADIVHREFQVPLRLDDRRPVEILIGGEQADHLARLVTDSHFRNAGERRDDDQAHARAQVDDCLSASISSKRCRNFACA